MVQRAVAVIRGRTVVRIVLIRIEHAVSVPVLAEEDLSGPGTDKEQLLSLSYPSHLWLEKEIKSVANVTRNDVQEFLPLAAQIPILPEIQEVNLEEANQALLFLKQGKIRGAGVLRMPD